MRDDEDFPKTPWPARLTLTFARRGERTCLVDRAQEGPLRVQKPLYPEGKALCHAIVLHPPAGIAAGDQLQIDIAVGMAAQVLLTTPGAGKWYRSSGPAAEQNVRLNVGAGGTAEWLPQENIVFDAAIATMRTTVELATGARYIGVETLCFGRRAHGECFSRGSLRMAYDISIDGRPLWHERGCIDGGSPLMASPIGLAGYSVCTTVIAAGANVDAGTLIACRQAMPTEGDAQYGVTAMPHLFIGRYLGHSAEAARQWFLELWRVLRPVFIGHGMAVPRIWST